MTSKFVPDKGSLFYMQVLPWQVHQETLTELKTVTRVDRSYQDQIFVCTASDDYCVVAKKVYPKPSSYENKDNLIRIENHKFMPVGPEVQQVLGLAEVMKG